MLSAKCLLPFSLGLNVLNQLRFVYKSHDNKTKRHKQSLPQAGDHSKATPWRQQELGLIHHGGTVPEATSFAQTTDKCLV